MPTAALVYKVVQREDSNGETVLVAKKARSESTVGGRKVASRAWARAAATEELLLVGTSFEEARLCWPGVVPVRCRSNWSAAADRCRRLGFGPARARSHLRARNELPTGRGALSEVEAAIPRYRVD